jgi:hypothetical protein
VLIHDTAMWRDARDRRDPATANVSNHLGQIPSQAEPGQTEHRPHSVTCGQLAP